MSLPARYFDHLYAGDPDPWGFRTRPYEERKRALTLAALPEARYGSIFEPGCSIGLLTSLLATRADVVVAMDVAASSIDAAARAAPDNVSLLCGAVPADWPEGTFDLVVISEIGYYLDRRDCQQLADLAFGAGTDVVAVHWRHPVEDYPLSGDEVHAILAEGAERGGARRLVAHVEDDLLLDVWSRDGRSVATRTGLAG